MNIEEIDKKITDLKYLILTKVHNIRRRNRKPQMIVVDYNTYYTLRMSQDFHPAFHQMDSNTAVNTFVGIPISVMLDVDREYIEVC